MKIIRKRNAAHLPASAQSISAGQPDGQHNASQSISGADYDAIIVQAAEQDLTQTPTTASLLLLNMLASRTDTVDVFLPGALHMITESELYSMCIHYAAQRAFTRSCCSVAAKFDARVRADILPRGGQRWRRSGNSWRRWVQVNHERRQRSLPELCCTTG